MRKWIKECCSEGLQNMKLSEYDMKLKILWFETNNEKRMKLRQMGGQWYENNNLMTITWSCQYSSYRKWTTGGGLYSDWTEEGQKNMVCDLLLDYIKTVFKCWLSFHWERRKLLMYNSATGIRELEGTFQLHYGVCVLWQKRNWKSEEIQPYIGAPPLASVWALLK